MELKLNNLLNYDSWLTHHNSVELSIYVHGQIIYFVDQIKIK
jgi:hypothetical protein